MREKFIIVIDAEDNIFKDKKDLADFIRNELKKYAAINKISVKSIGNN